MSRIEEIIDKAELALFLSRKLSFGSRARLSIKLLEDILNSSEIKDKEKEIIVDLFVKAVDDEIANEKNVISMYTLKDDELPY